MERLREHLGIDRWQVFGGSWGSALALAYAQTHPERVTELVLRGIFTLRRQELDWFYEGGASAVFPDLWEDFLAPVPAAERGHLIEAYGRLLTDPDPEVHEPAAIAWSRGSRRPSRCCRRPTRSRGSPSPSTPRRSRASRTTTSATAAGGRRAS